MSRLTKKEPNNLSCHHFRKCEYLRNGTPRVETLNKLGRLEDIMEKYNRDSVEEFDTFLQTLKDYIVKSQTYNCKTGTYSPEQLNIIINEDDGEDFKIVKKILWERQNYKKTWWLEGDKDEKES